MKIGELAEQSGLSRDTLRFYEKRGLLRPRRSSNGYRDYAPEALDWLRYLRTAQSLGFSLTEIEADLPLLAEGDAAAPALRVALRRKLAELDVRITALQALREELALRLNEPLDECPLRPAPYSAASGRPASS